MGPVNNILNRINTWNDPEVGAFKRVIGARAANVFVTVPTELAAVAQNVLLAPVYTASTALKLSAKTVAYISGSETVKNFEAKLPGFTELLRTVARIVAYSIGTILTATVGVISPKANFNMHCALGLAIDKREEVVKITFEEIKANEAAEKIEEQRVVELQELENLATAYTPADKIETEAAEDKALQDDFAELLTEVPVEENDVANTLIEEIEYQPEEEIEVTESRGSKVYDFGRNLVGGTYNMVAHPVNTFKNTVNYVVHPRNTSKSVYNYVSGFFVAQKA